jgi:ParB family chromosome partitioning protein
MAKIDRSKPRLGRGLSSLMAVSDTEETPSPPHLPVMISVTPAPHQAHSAPAPIEGPQAGEQLRQVSLESIVPNPHQPRRSFDEAGLAELAASLRSTGLIQPILVRPVGDGYQLIAGERRWRAARIAGIAVIPAIVRNTDSAIQAQMALVENIQREDLNPMDRAQSYRSIMDQLGLTQAELATRLGEDRSGIANYLRLLNLVESARELVRSGKLSFGHAKLLAGVEDMLEQQRLGELSVANDLSVRQLELLLKSGSNPTSPALTRSGLSAHIRDLEQSLSRQLGMRVQLRTRGKKGAGHLMIHYGSLDQFDELLTRMRVKAEAD